MWSHKDCGGKVNSLPSGDELEFYWECKKCKKLGVGWDDLVNQIISKNAELYQRLADRPDKDQILIEKISQFAIGDISERQIS